MNKAHVKAGTIAGSPDAYGYLQIMIDGKMYKAHRLAFLYMLGDFPPNNVDHINGKPGDNRWINLRAVTQKQNTQNRKATGRLRIRNVSPHGSGFRVKLYKNGRAICCGTYETIELAELVAIEARNKYFTHHTN